MRRASGGGVRVGATVVVAVLVAQTLVAMVVISMLMMLTEAVDVTLGSGHVPPHDDDLTAVDIEWEDGRRLVDSGDDHAPGLRFRFIFRGEEVAMRVVQNLGFMTKDYSHNLGGTVRNCHYHTSPEDKGPAWAAVSVCGEGEGDRHFGLRGLVRSAAGRLICIDPAEGGLHKARLLSSDLAHSFDGEPPFQQSFDTVTALSSERVRDQKPHGRALNADRAFVELLIVNDHEYFKLHQGDTGKRTARIVNMVSTLYERANLNPPVQVVLVGQYTFATEPEPWYSTFRESAEVPVEPLLEKFNLWRTERMSAGDLTPHDCGHLLSGLKFEGTVAGFAGVGTMCHTPKSGGINEGGKTEQAAAATLAHELAHNFGSGHIQQPGFIMSSSFNADNPPGEFAAETKTIIADAAREKQCLENRPDIQQGAAVCGNGFREPGEDCDCGDDDCQGKDRCCNGKACKLHDWAKCSAAFDSCCNPDSCSIIPAEEKKVCRKATSPCDLDEVCSGESARCPSDIVKFPGSPCGSTSTGACFGGQCFDYGAQCRTVGKDEDLVPCYSERQRKALNKSCDALLCRKNSEPGVCKTFKYLETGKQILVDDGTPCNGVSGQCRAGSCIDSETFAPVASCGNGVTEAGEECDCGEHRFDQTVTSCCDCATCKLKKEAECDPCDPCCTSECKIVPAGEARVCRSPSGSCDVEETCDGKTSECPADAHKQAGTPCGNDGEMCNMVGNCLISPDARCKKVDETTSRCPLHVCWRKGIEDVCSGKLRCLMSGGERFKIERSHSSNYLPCYSEGNEIGFCLDGTCRSEPISSRVTSDPLWLSAKCTNVDGTVNSSNEAFINDEFLIYIGIGGGGLFLLLCFTACCARFCRRKIDHNKDDESASAEFEMGGQATWYYADLISNSTQGPFTKNQLISLLRRNVISLETQVIQGNGTVYMPLQAIISPSRYGGNSNMKYMPRQVGMPADAMWFYHLDGTTYGPVHTAELTNLWDNGVVDANTMVMRQGESEFSRMLDRQYSLAGYSFNFANSEK
eukprot:g4237.t1